MLDRFLAIGQQFEPCADQWTLLSSIRRISAAETEAIVENAQQKGDLIGVRIRGADDNGAPDPWTLPPSRKRAEVLISGLFPESVEVTGANLVYIAKKGLPAAMLNRLLRIAAFQNPEFYKAQSMRLSTYDKPRVIACGEDPPNHIAVPRGSLSDVIELLERHSVKVAMNDQRHAGPPINVDFQGSRRVHQTRAVEAPIGHEDGILCAPTAFGKTAVAARLIAARSVPTSSWFTANN